MGRDRLGMDPNGKGGEMAPFKQQIRTESPLF